MTRSQSMSFCRTSPRRTAAAIAGLAVAVAGVLVTAGASGTAAHGIAKPRPTVVLVHGAFADSSGWNGVVARLQHDGYPVIAAANPLRGLASDAAYVSAVLHAVTGPVVLVGHSYGGPVITNAARGNSTSGHWSTSPGSPPTPARPHSTCRKSSPAAPSPPPWSRSRSAAAPWTCGSAKSCSPNSSRPTYPPPDARLMAVAQRPIAAAAPGEPSGEPSPPTSSSRPATRTSHPPRRRSWPNGPTQSWRSSRTPPTPCSSPSQASPPGSLNEPRRRRPDTRSGCSTRSPAITTKGATVSNHFSADKLKFPGDDPRLDLTDLFVFKTSDHADTTMLIIDVNPFMTAPAVQAGRVRLFAGVRSDPFFADAEGPFHGTNGPAPTRSPARTSCRSRW